MLTPLRRILALLLFATLALAGCNQTPTATDPATLLRWATKLDEQASQIRPIIAQLHAIPPDQWPTGAEGQARSVAAVLDTLELVIGEMERFATFGVIRYGMGSPGSEVATLMGMSAEEHGAMLRVMATLREDLDRMRGESSEAMSDQLPAYSANLQAMTRFIEQSAANLYALARFRWTGPPGRGAR